MAIHLVIRHSVGSGPRRRHPPSRVNVGGPEARRPGRLARSCRTRERRLTAASQRLGRGREGTFALGKPRGGSRSSQSVAWQARTSPPPSAPACPSTSTGSTAEGDGWLTPEDRYALKTHGVCAQLQAERVHGAGPDPRRCAAHRPGAGPGPAGPHATARTGCTSPPARTSSCTGSSDREVARRARPRSSRLGLSTRSACGHTLRNVMCSEDAGVGLDEPFDCLPDARLVCDAIVARSAELNCVAARAGVNMALRRLAPLPRTTPWSTTPGFVSTVRRRRAGLRAVGRRQPRQGAVAGGAAAPTFVPARRRARRGRGARRRVRRPRRLRRRRPRAG